MRGFLSFAMLVMVVGCGAGVETPVEEQVVETTQQEILAPPSPEARWCLSHPTPELCPKYYCTWTPEPAPGVCAPTPEI